MDEWGHGPWFDSPESDDQNTPDAGAGDHPSDAGQSGQTDQPDQADQAGQGSASGEAIGEGEQTTEIPAFRQPPIPSRPLGPDRSFITGAPAPSSSRTTGGPAGGWYSAASSPVSRPFPVDEEGFPTVVVPPPSVPIAPRQGGDRDNFGPNERKPPKKPRRGWLFVPVTVLLLIACLGASIFTGILAQLTGLINQHAPEGVSVPSIDVPTINVPIFQPTDTPTPKPTATPTPRPTPTPLVPVLATVSFTVGTYNHTSDGTMTSCPSGCDITGNSYTASQQFTSGSYNAVYTGQTDLYANPAIQVKNNGSSAWAPGTFSFQNADYKCESQPIPSIPAGATRTFPCDVRATTPQTLAAGTINGSTNGGNVVYTQIAALDGNGDYEAQASDCTAALNDLHGQGDTWAASWWSSQSTPAGWKWASDSPKISRQDSCPSGQTKDDPWSFTASSTTTAKNAAYDPTAAQTLAANRLNSTINGSYAWLSGSRKTCTPSVQSVDGNNKVTLNCSDSGTAYYIWTSSAKSSLAKNLAGHSKSTALSTCNKTTGVKANSCAITNIIGGDGTKLPASSSGITITPKGP